MFVLSGLILEAVENLFRDFGVRLVFLSFDFLREIIKNTNRPTGRTRAGLRPGAAYIKRRPDPPAHPASPPSRQPTAAQTLAVSPPPDPRRRRRAMHRRQSPPPEFATAEDHRRRFSFRFRYKPFGFLKNPRPVSVF